MKKPILVIKFGTASITNRDGELTDSVIADIARQVAHVHDRYRIVLVSSGAVAAGKQYISNYRQRLSERKAAAAIGNTLLLNKYSDYFRPYGISIAQSLCERNHFSNRKQFLQLKKTYEKLWDNSIIPIANENDVVSNLELKFSDNDELATLIAVGFNASLLLFSTSVPGVLDENDKLIKELDTSSKNVLELARTEKSTSGLGGMTSKLMYTRLANQMGIKAVIFGVNIQDGILKALNNETGTVCNAHFCSVSAKNRWLASGSLIKGKVKVDSGAEKALSKRYSLLAVGVQIVIGEFETGEVIEIIDLNNLTIAIAVAKVSSAFLKQNLNTQNLEVAHANDLVLV